MNQGREPDVTLVLKLVPYARRHTEYAPCEAETSRYRTQLIINF